MFWFKKKQSPSLRSYLDSLHWWYVLWLLFFFFVFSVLFFLIPVVKWDLDEAHIFAYIQRWSVYVSWLDPDFGKVLYAWQKLALHIKEEIPLFPDDEANMHILLDYVEHGGSRIIQAWVEKISGTWKLLQKFTQYREDIFSLLGKEKEQTYLIILQNTAEKRPNGGFFGSFVVVKIEKWVVKHFEIMDSYLPAFNKPWTSLLWPRWLLYFLPERLIYFVGANKIGFTYQDGANIKTLYEKSFPWQRVRGVIFVSTDMLQELLPSFREQQWAWQFTNAATDIIRWGDKRGKKELYIDHAKEYFYAHQKELISWLIKKLPYLLDQRYINIYLTDISGPFHGFLRREKLTTRFEKDTMYFWDSNISYSKIDNFSQKIIQFYDEEDNLVKETMSEIVSVDDLDPGIYTIKIIYTLHVPQYYRDFIHNLEQKYEIALTPREQHILAIDPEWATRGLIYMPPDMEVVSSTGDYYHFAEFDTPFAHGIYYKAKTKENNAMREIEMKIRK